MNKKIEDAIKLLKDNGYIVKKLSDTQIEDANDCSRRDCNKDCLSCSCKVCIVQ